METLHFSIDINGPKEKVLTTMLSDESYRDWTGVFMPGSHFTGSWEQGSKISFLAPDQDGKLSGLIGVIAENRPHEFISIEYTGVVEDGVEDTTSEEIQKWVGAHENYTFAEEDGVTTLLIDMDSTV